MLWSLIKIILFVVLVAAAAMGAVYLMELDGGVRIAAVGYEINLTPLYAVILLIALVFLVWLTLRLLALLVAVLKFINGDETALSRYFNRNRERKGYQALSEGMLALAAGEGRLAMAKASKAERYLHKPELTNLLTAQAAEMCGDRRKAEEVYKRLLKNDSTRFVAVRGIMKQKLADGDTATALKLAEKALDLHPKHEETQDVLLRLQASAHDWAGARRTLGAKLKYGSLPKDVHKRRDAVLALSEAKEVLAEGNDITAREASIEANKLSPDLIPAAAFAARGYIEQGNPKYATRVIKKAWAARPHPDLASAFAAIVPDETPAARLKRFKPLIAQHPDHVESRLLLAELNIANEDFPEARRALGDLVDTAPDARVMTVMAAIARGEGASDVVVKGWLARALTAPRGPQWVCEKCHNIHPEWVPICENCNSFDTLAWISPPAGAASTQAGSEMLPMIVGSIKDQSSSEDEDVPDAELLPDEETLHRPIDAVASDGDAARK